MKIAAEAATMARHPMAVVDLSHRFVWANQAYCRLVNRDLTELRTLTWLDITERSDKEVVTLRAADAAIVKTYTVKDGPPVRVLIAVRMIAVGRLLLEVQPHPPTRQIPSWAIGAAAMVLMYLAYLVVMAVQNREPVAPQLPGWKHADTKE